MTEKKEAKEDDSSVRVALRIRPQLAKEKIDMCQVCTSVDGEQVVIGKDKSFTFDYVFDMPTVQEYIYNQCVRLLIDGCFEGYNATVFAYGQEICDVGQSYTLKTGSGKTYTMGTGFDVNLPEDEVGIIPRAVDHLFHDIEQCKRSAVENNKPPPDFKVSAQFIELYNEEILDLLDTTRDPEMRRTGCCLIKGHTVMPDGKKSHIKIHEDATGGIYVVGVNSRPVNSLEDTMQCLKNGALSRATATTNMNAQSSRSHAIFTLHIKQTRVVHNEDLDEGKETDSTQSLNEFETLTAKFHFVDLAGSERLKRTGATGDRAKEGISINCGLLALGNVISALGDQAKKGCHVPYRDSKLTRLLQDSLGGNSRTLMIACISPSDRDFIETLNTLKYANRARNIKNKVTANQDKASKQLAALRAEIMTLQQELLEFKTGKRRVDADGVESVNDMFHENTMLQTENDKLRQRIKAMHETVENLTARNTELLSEKALLGVCNISEDAREDEVKKLVEGYIKELEELRGKLTEAEYTAEQYKRRASTSSRMGSSMSMIQGLSSPVSPAPMSSSLHMSFTESTLSIIDEGKKEINRLKKLKKSKRRMYRVEKEDSGDSEKEKNEADENSEEVQDNEEEVINEEEDQVNGDLNDDQENGEDDDIEEELEDLSSDESESEDKDSDNVHEDLAELTCEISIKQKLIEELEQSHKKIQAMKHQYEEKVKQLQQKIRATEDERDKVLNNISSAESVSSEKVKKVKQEFEKKLQNLQNDLKKMESAKRDHARLLKSQTQYEKQLKTLNHELSEMKKTKVKLMKQVKDESEKGKASEARRNREVAQLRKEQLRKENMIRNLEKEKQQKDVILRRKQEEVEALRKRGKPEMSSKAAGRVAKYNRPNTIPVVPFTSRRRRRADFNPKAAKQRWDSLEKNLLNEITIKQTILHMEKDMNIRLKEREDFCKRLDVQCRKRDRAIKEGADSSVIQDINSLIELYQEQIHNAQENITECQANIMQIEETKEDVDTAAIVNKCSAEEARYMLEHFIQKSISEGLVLSQKEAEVRELRAQLHQTELNNTLQQDLLRHMLNDHVDVEVENVDNLLTQAADEMESLQSSSSSSPAESMFENQPQAQLVPIVPVNAPVTEPVRGIKQRQFQTPTLSSLQKQKSVVRRKTPLPQELLYADGSSTPLLPLPETPEEENVETVQEPTRIKGDPPAVPPKPVRIKQEISQSGHENQMMPPPRTMGMMKVSSSSNLTKIGTTNSKPDPGPSPRFQRKEYTKPSPDPSPILRRKNYSSSSLVSRSSSVEGSSDATPPSSPTLSRRSRERPTDENVFSRLTSNTQPPSVLPPNRGMIVANTGKIPANKQSPVWCSHVAEGHNKAVLSLDATEDLLFTSSKDRTAKMWDLQTGKELETFSGHPNNVNRVRYCPKSRLIFTVSQSFVCVWDPRNSTKQCVRTLSSTGLTHDSPIDFGSSRQVVPTVGELNITDIALNQDGTALYSSAGNVVRVWDLNSFSAVGKLNGGHQAAVMVMAVDRQGLRDIVLTGSKDHYIKMFEVLEERAGIVTPKYNLDPPHYDGIQSLCVQGNTLFSGSRDMCIKKWDLASQQLIYSINSAHKDWICALKFMPGNDTLFSGCRGGYLKLWNMETCNVLGEIKAHSSQINAIATNSNAIFTASNDNIVGIWHIKCGTDINENGENME